MINGANRVYLPDGIELKLSSSSLHDPSLNEMCPTPCNLWITACYKERSVSIKIEGIPSVYIDRKPTSTNDPLKIPEGSVIEIQAAVIIYIVEFSYVRKESINLPAAGTGDLLRLKSKIYRWEMFTGGQLFTCTSHGFDEKREKVASFDLDGTLIKSKSGGYPKDHTDWILWHDSIISELSNLHNNGYKVIVFTNQAGILRPNSSVKLHLFKSKIESVINQLGIPSQFYMATYHGGPYRKPIPGMWKLMELNSKVKADLEQSFFVGDAAGREKDIAASDRIFAENIGLKFHTPEQFFLKESPTPYVELKYRPNNSKISEMPDLEVPSNQQEVIVMVGPPSSGKTFFVENYLIPKGYVPVSLDYFDDWNVSVPVLVDILERNKSAVVDHTNWQVSDRWKFIYLCKVRDIKVRCFVMEWSVNRCAHNNKFKKMFDPNYIAVSPKQFNYFKERFEPPTMEEGFARILSIPFIPKFKCKEMKFLYNCYLHSQ